MPEKLKEFFSPALVRSIAQELAAVHTPFDARAFVRACVDGLADKELLARGAHIAEGLRQHLPADFAAAARILVASLGPEQQSTASFGMAPFRYLPHTIFVARWGLDHFEESMHAQYELTKRFTAEGSIRAFLLRHPRETYARLTQWAHDPSVHVRRLVSEGTRPRLPWAPRLPQFQRDPAPVLRLLELLRDDPERYVQRSVANNLNDIGKDHPDLVVQVCGAWLTDAPPARRWIVKHALRSLVKQGHGGALALLGVGARPRVRLEAARFTPRRVQIGSTLRLAFEVVSTARAPQELLVDYAVHFVKANGSRRAKVFKLRRLSLAGGARQRLEARVSFANMSTRKHYPGAHAIEAVVNGVRFPLGEVQVRP